MQAIEGADKPRIDIQVSPWARERRTKAQKLLQYVLDRVRKLPGSSGGAPILESERLAAVSMFTHGIAQTAVDAGAQVAVVDSVTPKPHIEDPKTGQAIDTGPFEVVTVTALMPAPGKGKVQDAEFQMLEAVSECLRMLLAQAVGDAVEDAGDDQVLVAFAPAPELACRTDVEKGLISAGARMRVFVFSPGKPQGSFLLGNEFGVARDFELAINLPLVELFYGPNRLKWMDGRETSAEGIVPYARAPEILQ